MPVDGALKAEAKAHMSARGMKLSSFSNLRVVECSVSKALWFESDFLLQHLIQMQNEDKLSIDSGVAESNLLFN